MSVTSINPEIKEGWNDYKVYLKNSLWFNENLQDIKLNYPGKYIIISNSKIIISENNPKSIRDKLINLSKRNQAFVYYVPMEKEALIV
jgi:hypothetical protein